MLSTRSDQGVRHADYIYQLCIQNVLKRPLADSASAALQRCPGLIAVCECPGFTICNALTQSEQVQQADNTHLHLGSCSATVPEDATRSTLLRRASKYPKKRPGNKSTFHTDITMHA